MLWRRLTACVIASVLDLRDEVMAEVARMRGETSEPAGPHRYDPASVTDCIAERAHDSEPYSAEAVPGDVPREPPGFGLTRR